MKFMKYLELNDHKTLQIKTGSLDLNLHLLKQCGNCNDDGNVGKRTREGCRRVRVRENEQLGGEGLAGSTHSATAYAQDKGGLSLIPSTTYTKVNQQND